MYRGGCHKGVSIVVKVASNTGQNAGDNAGCLEVVS